MIIVENGTTMFEICFDSLNNSYCNQRFMKKCYATADESNGLEQVVLPGVQTEADEISQLHRLSAVVLIFVEEPRFMFQC